jgi:hypothetical protein
MHSVYNLTILPNYTQAEYGASGCITNITPDSVLWSGTFMPKIGDRVDIPMNDFGIGTVAGYFIEGNFLGVKVTLDNRPEWHRRQNPDRDFALVFGAEIRELTSSVL